MKILFIMFYVFCNVAFAEDGQLGTTSTGTAQISLYIPPKVEVQKVTNNSLVLCSNTTLDWSIQNNDKVLDTNQISDTCQNVKLTKTVVNGTVVLIASPKE